LPRHRRNSPSSVAASVLTCWLLAALPAAARGQEAPGFLAHESLGFELSPFLLNAFHASVDHPPPRFVLLPAGSVRVHRMRKPSTYWTPVAFGLGVGPGDDFNLLVQLQTEIGWVHRGRGTLELGLGLGIGTLSLEVRNVGFSCDGACVLGGGPLLLSPVARYLLIDTEDRLSLGAFVRAIVPVGDGAWFGYPVGTAVGVIGGLDVGLGYFQSPTPPPTAPGLPPRAMPAREWLGLELWCLTLNEGTPWSDPQPVAPRRYSLGAGADVRLLRLRGRFTYWTPLTLGLFWGPLGAPTWMAQARTEVGLLSQRRDAALELGLGIGYGGVTVVYAQSGAHADRCGGDCSIGGHGLAVSPVLRLSLARGSGRTMGVFLRYIAQNGEQGFLAESNGRAGLYLAGLDLGFPR
jgi:hypothetical protein